MAEAKKNSGKKYIQNQQGEWIETNKVHRQVNAAKCGAKSPSYLHTLSIVAVAANELKMVYFISFANNAK